jgi:hypothetical protein
MNDYTEKSKKTTVSQASTKSYRLRFNVVKAHDLLLSSSKTQIDLESYRAKIETLRIGESQKTNISSTSNSAPNQTKTADPKRFNSLSFNSQSSYSNKSFENMSIFSNYLIYRRYFQHNTLNRKSKAPLRSLLDNGESSSNEQINNCNSNSSNKLMAYFLSEKDQDKLYSEKEPDQQLKQKKLYDKFKAKRSRILNRRMPNTSQKSTPTFLIEQQQEQNGKN